jgi:hypothetical protein
MESALEKAVLVPAEVSALEKAVLVPAEVSALEKAVLVPVMEHASWKATPHLSQARNSLAPSQETECSHM